MKPADTFLPILAAALLLAGCATDPAQRDIEQLALYRAHSGAPVSSFRYFGNINSWTPLGDSAIAVWTSPGRAYLLDLAGPCHDLEFTPVIALTHQSGNVYARFDKVLVANRGMPSIPCRISEIRPLDVSAIRQAERTARAQASGT